MLEDDFDPTTVELIKAVERIVDRYEELEKLGKSHGLDDETIDHYADQALIAWSHRRSR